AGAGGRYTPSAGRRKRVMYTDDGSGTVGEDGVGDDPLRIPTVVIMQRAQFDGANEDAGVWLRIGEGAGDAQPVERAVTTHETDMRSLHGRSHAQFVDQFVVHAGRVKARARNSDEVADVGRGQTRLMQRLPRGVQSEGRGVGDVAIHALGSCRPMVVVASSRQED